ncbi:hypothetical protein [Nannocystis pusilla]|uniref:hypothetical protein n=1 Tax=Nannocystis pusilla TaxID=889268 RepID=UPI003DA59BAF
MLTTIAIVSQITLAASAAPPVPFPDLYTPEAPAAAGGALEMCGFPVESDPFSITAAQLVGDSLEVTVGYQGGCQQHHFSFCWDGNFLESWPVQVFTQIRHESNNDPCASSVTDSLTFDLSGLKSRYQMLYQAPSGQVVMRLTGWADMVYVF